MAGADTLTLTDADFDTVVLQSEVPVLVDFWAEWCMPCKALGPTIDELASEYRGRVKVGKLSTEDNNDTPMKYGIQAIPTVMLFHNGDVVKKFVGLTSKRELQSAIEASLQ